MDASGPKEGPRMEVFLVYFHAQYYSLATSEILDLFPAQCISTCDPCQFFNFHNGGTMQALANVACGD